MVKFGRAVRVPVDAIGIDLAAGAVQHPHVHARRVARVLAHLRDDILLQDAERHRPGRIEIDGGDVGGEHRRRPIGAPDLHDMTADDAVAFHRFGERRRQVDHDVALAEVEIHRRQPVERGRKLTQPLADRHVERGERLRTDAAGFLKPVPRLEMPHRRRQRLVIDVAGLLVGRQIVGQRKPSAQQRDLRRPWRRARAWRSPAASASRRALRAPNSSTCAAEMRCAVSSSKVGWGEVDTATLVAAGFASGLRTRLGRGRRRRGLGEGSSGKERRNKKRDRR